MEEHATGFIPGTDLNIDFREIQARHRDLGAQLEDRLVVYCQSGQRSNIAAETLADLGYRHVYNVTGSTKAWLAAGYPVESGRHSFDAYLDELIWSTESWSLGGRGAG